MPVYEYEPDDRDCLLCEGRVAVIQAIGEEPLKYCPWCGLEVRKVISRASIKVDKGTLKRSGDRGFTTWKRSEKGVWEKTSGEGADYLVGAPDDVAKVESDKKPVKKLDL